MRAASVIFLALLVLPTGLCMASVEDVTGEPSHESHQPAEESVHEHHEHERIEGEPQPDHGIGVDERLGERVPLDAGQIFIIHENGLHSFRTALHLAELRTARGQYGPGEVEGRLRQSDLK